MPQWQKISAIIIWLNENMDKNERRLAQSQRKHEKTVKTDSIDFLLRGLFCEWAYFVDFENQRMEVWASGIFLSELTFDEIISEGRKNIINQS